VSHFRRGVYSAPAALSSVVLKGAAVASAPRRRDWLGMAPHAGGMPGLSVELGQR
jgi:hypothetical protein